MGSEKPRIGYYYHIYRLVLQYVIILWAKQLKKHTLCFVLIVTAIVSTTQVKLNPVGARDLFPFVSRCFLLVT